MAGDTTNSRTGKPLRSDRSKRLLDLVMLLLRARAPVTFRAIRDQFTGYQTANAEAGLRAFERDKADLLELGVPVRYITPDDDEAVDEGGYVIDLKRYRLPEVHLTNEEISALVLAAGVARAVPGASYGRIVDLALRKLSFDFPSPDTPTDFPLTPGTASNTDPVLVHFPETTRKKNRELSDRFSELEFATRNRKRVTLSYKSASAGIVQSREIDPYGLVYRQGAWLVVGFCHLRGDVRSFRLDRIGSLKTASRPKSPDFERPADFDVRAYASRSPWTFSTGPKERVVLEFGPSAANIANEDFGPGAERDKRDGNAVVSFQCGNLDYVVARMLAAKGAIRIVSGEQTKTLFSAEVSQLRGMYS